MVYNVNMNWCFAIINNKLSEIYFEKERGKIVIIGHCNVERGHYKTKKEQRYIEEDTKKFQLRYRKKIYKDINTGQELNLSRSISR